MTPFTVRVLRTAEEKQALRAGDCLERDIPHFSEEVLNWRSYLAAFEGDQVVGLVGFVENSLRVPGALGVGFISTHRAHRQRGVARALVNALFEWALEQGKAIANTDYEPDGLKWLKPLMLEQARMTPTVQLIERQ